MNDEQWQAFGEGFQEAYRHATRGTPMKRIEVSFSASGANAPETIVRALNLNGALPHADAWGFQADLNSSAPRDACAHASGLRNLGSQAVCWECGLAFPLVELRPSRILDV